MIKLPQHITFFNKGYLIRYFRSIKKGSTVMIDGSINKTTDKDVREVIEDFVEAAGNRNLEVLLIKFEI